MAAPAAGERRPRPVGAGVRERYLWCVLIVTLALAALVLIRHRTDAPLTVSYYYFGLAFAITLLGRRAGLVVTVFLLTVGAALHRQLNALLGAQLDAWFYPGVEAAVGFLVAACLRHDRSALFAAPIARFPAGPLLLLHAWIAVSCAAAIGRNLWQSASEFTARGLWFNALRLRELGWHDDYFPLQDLFALSVAFLTLFAAWSLLLEGGRRLILQLAGAILAGAVANAAFGVWQRWTERGWFFDSEALSVNAFLPDMHSFGAFMASALFLGMAVFMLHARRDSIRALVAGACLLTAAGLFLSQSRSTVFLAVLLLGVLGTWAALAGRGWRRIAAIASIVVLVVMVDALLTVGYRGFTYRSLLAALAGGSDEALSYRPEIWTAAVRMYSQFPLFGLGQGAFYRLSAIPEFSQSPKLAEWGGENAHNYFLQTFVDLGPVGFGLALACLWPMVRLGRANRYSIAVYGLIGVAVGNLYAHALLIRELLVVTAVLVAIYFREAEALSPDAVAPLAPRAGRALGAAFVVGGLLAAGEAVTSLQRYPFHYGMRCHEQRPIAADGWATGLFRYSLPSETRHVELALAWERPDAVRRGLQIDFALADATGKLAFRERIDAASATAPARRLSFDLPPTDQPYWMLSVTSSSCYVPMNAGYDIDRRRLGVRVSDLRGG
jgi:O-antigen ligase